MLLLAESAGTINSSTMADIFATDANTFTMDFVTTRIPGSG